MKKDVLKVHRKCEGYTSKQKRGLKRLLAGHFKFFGKGVAWKFFGCLIIGDQGEGSGGWFPNLCHSIEWLPKNVLKTGGSSQTDLTLRLVNLTCHPLPEQMQLNVRIGSC